MMSMKKTCLQAAVFVFAFAVAGRADIDYIVSETVGTATVTGFILTDGKTGVLGLSDLLDWNLLVRKGPNGLELTGPLSGNFSTGVVSGNDLTATPTELLFNFSAVDQGYLLFQETSDHPSPSLYYCDAASNQSAVCEPGESLVAGGPTTLQNDRPLGNDVIGTVATPEPTFMVLTGLGFAGAVCVAYRRRRTV
jgi:hypothetical protein